MKVLGLGLPELLIILAVVLLIFGPKHLPKLGAALGATVKNLREGLGSNNKEEEEVIDKIVEDEEEPAPRKATKSLESGTDKKTTRRAKVSAEPQEAVK